MSQAHDSGEQSMTQVRVERSHVRRQRAFEEPRIVRKRPGKSSMRGR